ncbi:MAG TPA: sigma-70 family RNA polymerase sigma factor [Gemmataceae bacterium]
MADDSFNIDTLNLRRLLDRMESGELTARDELLRACWKRLELLARKMLRRFPIVRRWAETDDVLQSALLRLLRALRDVQPANTREFFGLAAVQIRRELLDLARHFNGEGFAPLASANPTTECVALGLEQALEVPEENEDLDLWCRFHESVDQLPAQEREVIGLSFYDGLTQVQIADLLQVDERTVRRRWRSACLLLNQMVGGELPLS